MIWSKSSKPVAAIFLKKMPRPGGAAVAAGRATTPTATPVCCDCCRLHSVRLSNTLPRKSSGEENAPRKSLFLVCYGIQVLRRIQRVRVTTSCGIDTGCLGHNLTQQQIDIMVPIVRANLDRFSKNKFAYRFRQSIGRRQVTTPNQDRNHFLVLCGQCVLNLLANPIVRSVDTTDTPLIHTGH